jgi:hypothetical protein
LVEMAAVRLVPLAPFPVGLVAGAIFADQFAAALRIRPTGGQGAVIAVLVVGTVAARSWLGNTDFASRPASSGAADRAYDSARAV